MLDTPRSNKVANIDDLIRESNTNKMDNTVKIEEKGKELMNFMTRAEEIKMSRLQGSNIMRTMRRYSSSVNVGGLMRQKKPSIQVSNQ